MARPFIAFILSSALVSGMMSAIVCGVMTYKMAGLTAAFTHIWLGGWTTAWPVAFTVILLLGPAIRKGVYRACNCPIPKEATQAHTEIPRSKASVGGTVFIDQFDQTARRNRF